ncbi:MAG: asparagine synthase [Candidatus Saccharibacteria bacterium]|nr:asparagine synthase [Candidatus Saccharibacteria bacterium]
MEENRKYCASSFLMYRTITDHNKCFSKKLLPCFYDNSIKREPINNSLELEEKLKMEVQKATKNGKAALALSGGIDSAILAKFMPKGSTAYTFQCIVPGKKVTNESPQAAKYAEKCNLKHKIIKVYWEDFEKYTPILMQHKGAPFHSIEVQIYKAALEAKKDGFDTLIFGESADLNYGGLSDLLSKDWLVGEFIQRYAYVLPYEVLKEPELILEPIIKYAKDGYVDVHEFNRHDFYIEAMGSYTNACNTAKITLSTPYAHTFLTPPLNLERIRNGENKYFIREIFNRLYPGFKTPVKTPMPRPMNEWLADWQGPTRPEFWPHCTDNMTGDQKWLVYILESFLNLCDEIEVKNS